jgi:DNA polymerase kappa
MRRTLEPLQNLRGFSLFFETLTYCFVLLNLAVLSEFDPSMSAYSLDEAYLDLGPYLACRLTHPEWSHEQIREALSGTVTKIGEALEKEEGETPVKAIDWAEDDADHEGRPGGESQWTHEASYDVLLSFPPATCLTQVESIVSEMRRRVFNATGLTCSAGVAPNFLLAKIASDRNKPNGQLVVASDHGSVTGFLYPLAIRKVSGIGRVSEKCLKAFGISTVGELYEQRALVRFLFQQGSTATFLLRASVGCSSSDGKVSEEDETSSAHQKGISRERTMQPGKSWTELNSRLEDIAHLLSDDMKRKKLWAHTLTVKVKLHTFECLSRSRTMSKGVYLQSKEDLTRVSTEIFHEIRSKEMEKTKGATQFSPRLLGIRCSNLQEEGEFKPEAGFQMNIDQFLRKGQAENRLPSRLASSRTPSPNRRVSISPFLAKKRSRSTSPVPARSPKTFVDGNDATRSIQPNIKMDCPICGKSFSDRDEAETNVAINRHIDSCLSGSTVRQAAREESTRATTSAVHQQRPTRNKNANLIDFFSTCRKKQPESLR